MAKVYVSSTVADLEVERRAVMEWLVTAGHQPVHSYRPDSETVRESCLTDIDGCDLYVLILGHRYGFQPKEDNPEKLSITHLELKSDLLSSGGYCRSRSRIGLGPCCNWCGRRDLNPHGLRRHPLKMVCLPIPPLPH